MSSPIPERSLWCYRSRAAPNRRPTGGRRPRARLTKGRGHAGCSQGDTASAGSLQEITACQFSSHSSALPPVIARYPTPSPRTQLSSALSPRPSRGLDIHHKPDIRQAVHGIDITAFVADACQQRVSGARSLSGVVARRLSGFMESPEEVPHETDGAATGGAEDAIRGSLWRLAGEATDTGGGGRGLLGVCERTACPCERSGAGGRNPARYMGRTGSRPRMRLSVPGYRPVRGRRSGTGRRGACPPVLRAPWSRST